MGRPGYPEDMREFGQQFAANAACVEYVVRCRWPDGFVCPKCSGTSAWLHSQRYVFEGRACGRQTLPIAGTIMHRSHVPGQEWFGAACFVATHTPGISALQLQRQFGVAEPIPPRSEGISLGFLLAPMTADAGPQPPFVLGVDLLPAKIF